MLGRPAAELPRLHRACRGADRRANSAHRHRPPARPVRHPRAGTLRLTRVKSTPKPDAELTWPQVHAYRLRRHHLAGRAPTKDLARVVGEIGGAQAQLMSAAELQIAVRVNCTVSDVRKALWADRTLVKTWLMRGTLHLARSADLPVYTAAMSTRWVSQMRPSWLKFMQITEPEFWTIV